MAQNFEKKIVERVKSFKCSQQKCLSQHQDNYQIAVFGNQGSKTGLMCSSCFIDDSLIKSLKQVQNHAVSIRKFMSLLTKQYGKYVQIKSKVDWIPNLIEAERVEIKKFINQTQRQLMKKISQIIKYVQESGKEAINEVKRANHDQDLQKINQLLSEDNQSEQQRIDISKELKSLSAKIQRIEGVYRLDQEQQIKTQNQKIAQELRRKVQIAEQALKKLIEVQKKAIKYLVE